MQAFLKTIRLADPCGVKRCQWHHNRRLVDWCLCFGLIRILPGHRSPVCKKPTRVIVSGGPFVVKPSTFAIFCFEPFEASIWTFCVIPIIAFSHQQSCVLDLLRPFAPNLLSTGLGPCVLGFLEPVTFDPHELAPSAFCKLLP